MSSITVLEDRLTAIESMMQTISIEIEALESEAESKLHRRNERQKDFNGLDEETVELRETINLLKEARETHG